MVKCRCLYQRFLKKGYMVIDHAWHCPLNNNFIKQEKFISDRTDIKNKEISPFEEIWLDKKDIKKYQINKDKITKGLRNAKKNNTK